MSDYPQKSLADGSLDLSTAVMESCLDAIIACNSDGTIVAWNRGAFDTYGYTPEEAIGRSIKIILPPERYGELECMISAAQDRLPINHYDTVRLRKTGDAFPAAVCGFFLCNEQDEVRGFATIERDVSERVETAEALQAALEKAEAANIAQSSFLANVSHELRTPMNAIVGMAALALEEDLSPELTDYMQTISDSADVLMQLLNDVLDLSKVESDHFELDEVTFHPRELVESTLRVLASAAHSKGLELISQVDADLPEAVVGDPMRLRQVLTNLVGNAIKFTSSGEVIVKLDVLQRKQSSCELNFRVVDTGIGISEDDQQRIFAPFTQVDSATTRRFSGTGLGLTICQHLIGCFGSELSVDSQLGAGSCFSFTADFPIAEEPPPFKKDSIATQLRGLRVLIIDDNETSRNTLARLIASWEMQPTVVDSGKEGLEKLKHASAIGKPFHVALIDALMPELDGFSVASQIETDKELCTKPVLLASTTDRLEFSRRCAEAGAVAFVEKPVCQSQLLGAVAQATGVASLDTESRQGLFDRPLVAVPMNILLVEDTPANRKVVQRVLNRRGHTLEIAVNGREAIDRFRKSEYDLILMDVQMPIMDGLQATLAIREIEQESEAVSDVPIVAMTAHSLRGDRQRCLKSGMNGYLSKPIDLHKLIAVVESYARGRDESPATDLVPPVGTSSGSREQSSADLASQDSCYNLESALQRLRGDRQLLSEMIGFFAEDYSELLTTMHEAIQTNELQVVERSAHSLKGLVATFDAYEAMQATRDVEIAAKAEKKEQLFELGQQASRAVTALAEELSAYAQENAES